jgi:amino acid transporter
MYAAVVHLRRTQPDAPRPFRIPGGRIGLTVIVGIGVTGSVFTFLLGFLPASHLSVEGTVLYVLAMVIGIVAVCGTPFLLHRDPGPGRATPVPDVEPDAEPDAPEVAPI